MNSENKHLIASIAISNYIKSFESLKLKSYLCPAGVWTIGYGTTILPSGDPVIEGMVITRDTAEYYMKYDLEKFGREIYNVVLSPLNQNQFDALISLVYNIGGANFGRSTVLKKLNIRDYNSAADNFLKWNKAKNPKTGLLQVYKGLTIRRQKERQIFLTPVTLAEDTKLISMIDSLKAKTFATMYRKNSVFNYDTGSYNFNIIL